jgi:hypothetical protein
VARSTALSAPVPVGSPGARSTADSTDRRLLLQLLQRASALRQLLDEGVQPRDGPSGEVAALLSEASSVSWAGTNRSSSAPSLARLGGAAATTIPPSQPTVEDVLQAAAKNRDGDALFPEDRPATLHRDRAPRDRYQSMVASGD